MIIGVILIILGAVLTKDAYFTKIKQLTSGPIFSHRNNGNIGTSNMDNALNPDMTGMRSDMNRSDNDSSND